MANKEFSEKIQKARINAGLSQRDVAEFLGYSTPQFISNWETTLLHLT
jgi:transcriptional regulator with XRE-family HTH domain